MREALLSAHEGQLAQKQTEAAATLAQHEKRVADLKAAQELQVLVLQAEKQASLRAVLEREAVIGEREGVIADKDRVHAQVTGELNQHREEIAALKKDRDEVRKLLESTEQRLTAELRKLTVAAEAARAEAAARSAKEAEELARVQAEREALSREREELTAALRTQKEAHESDSAVFAREFRNTLRQRDETAAELQSTRAAHQEQVSALQKEREEFAQAAASRQQETEAELARLRRDRDSFAKSATISNPASRACSISSASSWARLQERWPRLRRPRPCAATWCGPTCRRPASMPAPAPAPVSAPAEETEVLPAAPRGPSVPAFAGGSDRGGAGPQERSRAASICSPCGRCRSPRLRFAPGNRRAGTLARGRDAASSLRSARSRPVHLRSSWRSISALRLPAPRFSRATGERLLETTAQQEYPLLTPSDGGAELEPGDAAEGDRAAAWSERLRGYAERLGLAGRPIEAVGVFVLLAQPASARMPRASRSPASSPGPMPAAAQTPPSCAAKLGEKAVHARTGCMLRASFWPAKLVWLRRTQPTLFRRVRRWMSPAEWLQRQFCGEANCAIGMATGTGLFDPTKLAWDDALLGRCAVAPEQLGAVSDEPSGDSGQNGDERFPELNRRTLVSRHRRWRRQQSRLRRDAARPRRDQLSAPAAPCGSCARGEKARAPLRALLLPRGCGAFPRRRRGEQCRQSPRLVPARAAGHARSVVLEQQLAARPVPRSRPDRAPLLDGRARAHLE